MAVHSYITSAYYTTNYVDYAPCTGAALGVEDYVMPCFVIKHDSNCITIIIEDKTDYLEIPVGDVTVTVNAYFKEDKNDEYKQVCSGLNFEKETINEYDLSLGSGYYKFLIHLQVQVEDQVYSKEYEECIVLDCCKSKVNKVLSDIKSRIADIGCKINERELIGRSAIGLYSDMNKLLVAMFYLEDSVVSERCDDLHIVNCFINSIKKYC